jgi:hypothetical protein
MSEFIKKMGFYNVTKLNEMKHKERNSEDEQEILQMVYN